MIHAFGAEGAAFEFDEELWELRCQGERVRVQPKVLALLFHLARNAKRVVPSDELLGELWPDEVVTKSSLARAVSLARSALVERGAPPEWIETVSRRGYRFRAELAQVTRAREPAGAELLVGRDSLLGELRADYTAAAQGGGRIALLRGEAGIGKTRLLDELGRAVRADGVAVLGAWCSADSGQPPLWPWARIARDALALRPAVTRTLGRRIAAVRALAEPAEARDTRASSDSGGDLRAGAETFKLVDGLVALLRGLAADRPLVVALDDLQWADRASLRVLELCARDLRSARVLLLLAVRDEGAPNESLESCLAALGRLPHARSLRVDALGRADTAALVRGLWGAEPPADVIDSIWSAGLGNPLFTHELVRHVRAGGGESLPPSVKVLLDAKLARLTPAASELLRVAAVIGAEPALDLLRAVSGIDPPALAERVAELAECGVASSAPGSPRRLRFAHPLVREAVLAEDTGAERLRLHRRIAEELESLGAADPDSIASEVAEHRLALAAAGGDAAPAAEWAERAARVALRRCAYDDAARGHSRALEALRTSTHRDPRRELGLLLSLGDAHARANQLGAGADAAEAAAALARRLGDGESLARAALLVFVRGPESGGPYDRVLALLEEAERGSRGAPTRARARVTARLAHELFFTPGTIARRVALADESRELARDADHETRLFVGYHALIGTWSRVRARERARVTGELVGLADEARDPAARFLVSAPYIASLLECGRLDDVDREIETLARRVETLEVSSFFAWHSPVYRGMRALLDGRFDAAERLVTEGRDLGVRAQNQDALRNYAGQYSQLLHDLGREREIEPALRGMRERFPRISVWRAGWMRMLASLGERDSVHAELAAWEREGFPDPLDDSNGVISLVLLAGAASRIGAKSAAHSLLPLLEGYSGENAAPAFGALCLGPIDLALGELCLVTGDHARALTLLEPAERSAERLGARPMLARARLSRARALAARGARADAARARELAGASAALAESLGMPDLAREARSVGI